MPVTIVTAKHTASVWNGAKITTVKDLLTRERDGNVIGSSFSETGLQETHITSSSNGLVYAVYYAYSKHHHLTIRPEDVWLAILSQLSFYINAHAKELRSHFVTHTGQKELIVHDVGTIDTLDISALAQRMTELIQNNIVDPGLRAWMLPDFSTTTNDDRTVAAVLMMGTMQKYFSYECCLDCGIPSVTLLGERQDWENILRRLTKLSEFGDEPAAFAELLRPIVRNFIATFAPQAELDTEVRDFWSRVADRRSDGSGPDYLSGWITAFCMWDEHGKLLRQTVVFYDEYDEVDDCSLVLEGVTYPQVDMEKIPSGLTTVPVKVDDNGYVHMTKMVAGSLGIRATSSGQKAITSTRHQRGDCEEAEDTMEAGLDSLQPVTGWIMYEKE